MCQVWSRKLVWACPLATSGCLTMTPVKRPMRDCCSCTEVTEPPRKSRQMVLHVLLGDCGLGRSRSTTALLAALLHAQVELGNGFWFLFGSFLMCLFCAFQLCWASQGFRSCSRGFCRCCWGDCGLGRSRSTTALVAALLHARAVLCLVHWQRACMWHAATSSTLLWQCACRHA